MLDAQEILEDIYRSKGRINESLSAGCDTVNIATPAKWGLMQLLFTY